MKSILLIGLGRFGSHVAQDLRRLGHEVMAVDNQERRVNDILPYVTNAQIGDSTNQEFLASLAIKSYDVCIVAIGTSFQSSLETTCYLKELGAKLVVSRASSDVHAKFLRSNGADEIIYPELQMAKWAAIRYSADHILDYIDLGDSNAIFEVAIPKDWIGRSIGQLQIRRKYNINILAVKEDKKLNVSLTPDTVLSGDKTLLVLGEYKMLQKCFRL